MTVAQFFRINGGTTQLRGVVPDILFPAVIPMRRTLRESSFDNALPWAHIKAADYSPVGDLKGLIPLLLALHETRVKKDKGFRSLQEDIAESKLKRKKNLISLNESERRKERDAQEIRFLSRDARKGAGEGYAYSKGSAIRDDGLQPDERNLANQLAAEKERKDSGEIFLNEAVNILSDEVEVLKNGGRLAVRVKPNSLSMPN